MTLRCLLRTGCLIAGVFSIVYSFFLHGEDRLAALLLANLSAVMSIVVNEDEK
jgi:hypothetical protein